MFSSELIFFICICNNIHNKIFKYKNLLQASRNSLKTNYICFFGDNALDNNVKLSKEIALFASLYSDLQYFSWKCITQKQEIFKAFSSDTREILRVCRIHLSIQFSDNTSDLSQGKTGYRMFSRRDLEYVDSLCFEKSIAQKKFLKKKNSSN